MIDVSSLKTEEVTREATEKGRQVVCDLQTELSHGGVVGTYMSDQLVIYMALSISALKPSGMSGLSSGQTRSEILVGKVSSHTLTAMKICEDLLTDIVFYTQEREASGLVIVCERKGNHTIKPLKIG